MFIIAIFLISAQVKIDQNFAFFIFSMKGVCLLNFCLLG